MPQLARRESGKKSGPAEEARDHCFGVHEERGFRAPPLTPFWLAEFLLKGQLYLMGIPFYVICCFSLAAFNIFSLNLIFDSWINMCLSINMCHD